MAKLHLSISEKIQGDFTPQDLNLMIVFQVNCPGCIASAIHNAENTHRLVKEGHLVDHSLSFMKQHGHDTLPYKITFPILMDTKMQPDDAGEVAQAILAQHASYHELSDAEKKAASARIVGQLNKQSDVYISFTVNQFRGSPSFVLFNKDYDILERWFGHTSKEDINERIARHS